MVDTLVDNPLLTLFGIVALGYLAGRVRIGSFSLGLSAVLFVGLGVSAAEPRLELPEVIYLLGLVLFVYTIGLSSGPSFFATIRTGGMRLNAVVLALIVASAVECLLLVALLDVDRVVAAGMFTGALTNTPALAAILDALPRVLEGADSGAAASRPVVGYSLAYPIGVLGTIAVMWLLERMWRVDHAAEAAATGLTSAPLEHWTVQVQRRDRPAVRMLAARTGTTISASRVLSGDAVHIADPGERLDDGDLVTLVGTSDELAKATAWLGARMNTDLARADELDSRRMFVSNPEIVGIRLADLQLPERRGITVTRIRRGDVDMVATPDSVLELGDRVRLVAPGDRMVEAADFVGDSYRDLSELDVLTFAVGIELGLLVGLIPVPIPGLGTIHLGSAGGPLVVALLLGAVGRTGPLVWQIPYSANLTLRQLGVVLFLAGIGTRAGPAFKSALSDPASLVVIATGAALTISVAVATLVVAHRVMHVTFGRAMGMLAGLQTQPAVLAYANEQARTELPNRGYTTVYPLAMITKIITAQILLVLLV
ncbi:MAG TPA: aspartate:alanine exchanger family transporter [Solirubrobacteraceae bacterium]|nr:aspartate:alanine exchanger family transporter [Solirubrobacteraceae bacterium]